MQRGYRNGYVAKVYRASGTRLTQRANELLDTHLTTAVVDRFDAERENFDITHLKVGLSRKSGQTKAEYEVDLQTKLTKVTSEILSEGEQRALALAGFLPEVALTDGSGPIIVDDPVSSLRQVVVFTHDIIFFNELCQAADAVGIDPVTISLFSDKKAAGRIDPSGIGWKGVPVKKRLGRIKDAFAPFQNYMPRVRPSMRCRSNISTAAFAIPRNVSSRRSSSVISFGAGLMSFRRRSCE